MTAIPDLHCPIINYPTLESLSYLSYFYKMILLNIEGKVLITDNFGEQKVSHISYVLNFLHLHLIVTYLQAAMTGKYNRFEKFLSLHWLPLLILQYFK